MITVKKDAIKIKTSDGMQSAGVLCKVSVKSDYSYYDEFWDSFQDNGQLKNYANVFRSASWNDETFKPKYSFIGISTASSMFMESMITDLTKVLENANVTLDTSKVTYSDSMFRSSKVTRVPYLDLSMSFNCSNMFGGCTNLECIDYIKFPSKNYGGMFSNCIALKDITVESGTIRTTISFGESPLLSDTSIQSIIDGLADLTGSTAQTITFHKDLESKISDEQKAQITSKNWTLAFAS